MHTTIPVNANNENNNCSLHKQQQLSPTKWWIWQLSTTITIQRSNYSEQCNTTDKVTNNHLCWLIICWRSTGDTISEDTIIMGIQSQHLLLFKSNEIEFNNIVYINEQCHAEQWRHQIISRVRPTVTTNASLIGYKYLGTSLHPSNEVYFICYALANWNIDVLIMCNPQTRHYSKRAHHQRVGKKEKDMLKLVMLCCLDLSCAGNVSEKIWQITDTSQNPK